MVKECINYRQQTGENNLGFAASFYNDFSLIYDRINKWIINIWFKAFHSRCLKPKMKCVICADRAAENCGSFPCQLLRGFPPGRGLYFVAAAHNYACVSPCLVSLSRGILWNYTFNLPYPASGLPFCIEILSSIHFWRTDTLAGLTASPDIRQFRIHDPRIAAVMNDHDSRHFLRWLHGMITQFYRKGRSIWLVYPTLICSTARCRERQ